MKMLVEFFSSSFFSYSVYCVLDMYILYAWIVNDITWMILFWLFFFLVWSTFVFVTLLHSYTNVSCQFSFVVTHSKHTKATFVLCNHISPWYVCLWGICCVVCDAISFCWKHKCIVIAIRSIQNSQAKGEIAMVRILNRKWFLFPFWKKIIMFVFFYLKKNGKKIIL